MYSKTTTIILLLMLLSGVLPAQKIKDFFYIEKESKELPVFVRGNLKNDKLLLFIQGGDAEKGIDFGRSNYPGWKNTLESDVAIAYFDQRGLNKRVNKIDTTKINPDQVCKDILLIAQTLKNKYQTEIYLIGHSSGGASMLSCLSNYSEEFSFIKGAIALNTPITNDFSRERYNYYRPLYLKNLASEFVANEVNTEYWQEAYEWMDKTDSIHKSDISKKWNEYVDSAFEAKKKKVSLKMIFKVIFSKPYNPINYLNRKDEKFVSERLWSYGRGMDRWKELPQIDIPILLVTGRFDSIATVEEQEDVNDLIPNSDLVILPSSSHESFLDQPDSLNNVLLKYINVR